MKAKATQQVNILIVDDEMISRIVLAQFIENIGFKAIVANDGEDAMSKILEKKFDLIITDLNMPKLDGIKMTEMIRSSNDLSNNTPIFGITAHLTEECRTQSENAGMNGLISKPVTFEKIKDILDEFVPRI